MDSAQPPLEDTRAICQACGACCSFSFEWPRFSLEDDAALDRIPRAFVDGGQGRMRCDGDRCAALAAECQRIISEQEGRVGVQRVIARVMVEALLGLIGVLIAGDIGVCQTVFRRA